MKPYPPKSLFLLDGVGALLTAVLLSQVLARFESYFGISSRVLTVLALIAVLFAIYSITCSFILPKNWPLFLKGIAVANMGYILISLSVLAYYSDQITSLGVFYFISEILVILGLVWFEWNQGSIER